MSNKILMISWAWRATGGDWTYIENLKKLYETKGYEIIPFSVKNDNNIPAENGYFIDGQDYRHLNKTKNITNVIKAFKNAIVSKAALETIEEILNMHDIVIAHLHNIHHHLTPAIIKKLSIKKIKIIWSLHDYKIICPENSFVSNGNICEKCLNKKFINCTLNRCKKDSFSASFLTSLEAYYYHGGNTYDLVDTYLCPSKFLQSKFKQAQFQIRKLHVSNYCYDINNIDDFIARNPIKKTSNKYILYVGRIETIKGIRTLIDAVTGTNVFLKIVGSGAELDKIKAHVGLFKINNIQFLGFQKKDAVFNLIHNASFVVCPSEWYENYPFSVIESLLFSKPVIGANIGGIPELVIHNKTGLLFEAGNANDLRDKILLLWSNNYLQSILGTYARINTEHLVSFESHWNLLEPILARCESQSKNY